MKHKDFWINSSGDGKTLAVNLNNWKLYTDQFYRASECLFKQVLHDHKLMLEEHLHRQKAKNFNGYSYHPTLDHVYFLQVGYCLENIIKGILVFNDPLLLFC